MSTHTAAAAFTCVDVSRSLGCQFFPCLLRLVRCGETGDLLTLTHTDSNVDPRLNEIQPKFRMVVFSGVNKLC